jgi:hypothetical protein
LLTYATHAERLRRCLREQSAIKTTESGGPLLASLLVPAGMLLTDEPPPWRKPGALRLF